MAATNLCLSRRCRRRLSKQSDASMATATITLAPENPPLTWRPIAIYFEYIYLSA